MRRAQPKQRTAATRSTESAPNPDPVPPERVTVAPVTPAASRAQNGAPRWLVVLDWGAWIALWVSAVGAGYFLGRIDVAKALFIAILLAITVLPWLRWVRLGSTARLVPSRIAGLQGALAILVALVLALSGTYVWALAVLVVELPLAMLILIKTPRPAQQI